MGRYLRGNILSTQSVLASWSHGPTQMHGLGMQTPISPEEAACDSCIPGDGINSKG